MAKTEVYSWRIEPELKAAMEEEARRRNQSLSALLEEIAREWLEDSNLGDKEELQQRLHDAARRCFGTIAGSDPRRSAESRNRVREKLRRRPNAG